MSTLTETFLKDLSFDGDLAQDSENDGQVGTTEGLENIKNALIRRISTERGSLIHRPEYGASLKRYQGAPLTMDVRRAIALAVKEQVERDPRVIKLETVAYDQDKDRPDKVTIIIKVTLQGYGEAIPVSIPFGEF